MNESKDEEVGAQYNSSIEAANAFLAGEKTYVESGLRIGFETFYNRLQVHCKLNKTIISESDIIVVFGNYSTLYNANSNLLSSLTKLRLDGELCLRDGIGKVMVDFIPYLKLYIDYIVKKQDAMDKLFELKKGNKKFREFLKINEACVKRKLKSFLDEPVLRLPQYLQGMASVYEAMRKEGLTSSNSYSILKKAIVDIQKVTDEIALKSRDKKARRLVGRLQQKIFKNKIALIASHRYVVEHGTLKLVQKKSAINHHIILCNDILCISTEPSKLLKGSLIAVFPLIGVRLVKNVKIDESLQNEGEFRFAIIPQNKNFTPSESNAIGSVVLFCDSNEELQYWCDIIEDTVDIEEHNLRPCNPVDLEKRLRKERCSNEGIADTIQINDKSKIQEIEEWKKQRQLHPRPKIQKPKLKPKLKTKQKSVTTRPTSKSKFNMSSLKGKSNNNNNNNNNNSNSNTSKSPSAAAISAAALAGGAGKSLSKPPQAPKQSPQLQQSQSLPDSSNQGSPPQVPQVSQNGQIGNKNSGSPPQTRRSVHSGPPPKPPGKGAPPPRRISHGVGKPPPRRNAPPRKVPPARPGASRAGVAPKSVASPKVEKKTIDKKSSSPNGGRANFLASIGGFKKNALKKVSESETENKRNSVINNEPETMGDLLHNTLANYRQFVMDDEDDDESDEDWE